jgi:hypothetical protein
MFTWVWVLLLKARVVLFYSNKRYTLTPKMIAMSNGPKLKCHSCAKEGCLVFLPGFSDVTALMTLAQHNEENQL